MELKSLKIFGFKSFPDEINFEFEHRITAIIGPNGCGKSNIVEAIRWTLGEQNVHSLRAVHTEQLIFNGSHTRKPLGMAEVSLTFSNPNDSNPTFSEINVTRKLFSSGVSEYFLNKVPCRLKDITEVFMDTGLGVNAYSMMSQEQVEMILSAKPEERRLLFEEAAGITKYSKRKNEALRKLELTKQNLLRIQDIISELERQSNSLKRQAYKAKKYQQLREELKNLQILGAFYQYKKFQAEKQKVDTRIESIGKEKDGVVGLFEEEEESLKNLQDELTKLESDLEEKREEQLDLAGKIERGNSVLVVNEERIKNLSSKLEEEKEEKLKLEKELAVVLEEIPIHAKAMEETTEEEKELKVSIEENPDKIAEILKREKENEKELEEKNSQLIECLSEKARLKNTLENSRINIHNLEVKLKKLVKERGEIVAQKLSLEEELNIKKEEILKDKASIEKIETKINSLEKSLGKLEENIASIEKGVLTLSADLQMKKSHLTALKEMHSRDEGFQDSVKFIMESEKNPHIHGLVFNLLEVPEEFQRAIEVALRDKVQGLVVKDNKVVSNLIRLLKEKEKGRATFLPVEAIKKRKVKINSNYELAINKVKFPQEFVDIFTYLLDGVVIAKDWDEAMKLYSSLPEEFEIVTRDGELLHPRGFIQGGSRREIQALIGRKERIQKIEKGLNILEERLKEMEQKKTAELSGINKIEQELKEKKDELTDGRDELSKLEKEVGSITENMNGLNKRDKFLVDEQENLEDTRKLEEEKNKEHEKKLDAIEEKVSGHSSAIESLKKSHETSKEEEKKANELLGDKKIKLISLKQARNIAEETLKSLEYKKETLLEEVLNIDTVAKEAREKVEFLRKELEENMKKSEEQRQRTESLKENLGDLKEKRALLNEKCREKERLIREKEAELGNRKDLLNSFEIEKIKLETEMKDLKENISSTHGISLDDFSPQAEKIEENLKEKIDDLKRKLDSMGNVNLAAIEEEEELDERYNFYLTQQKDLLDSEQSLQDTISKINSTARGLFRSTLDSVRKEFRDVFINLFQGGEADLKLVGSQDVLEAGVDIVVSPPGKKLASISLLSGGERALTAIALLFSLFKVKPSPFCVLDEIDASLDDANIERFTNFLQKLAKDTQFIIISHNKKTLAISEVLYGVTMEEPGVSKLISVKFKNKSALPVESSESHSTDITSGIDKQLKTKNVAQG